MSLSHFDIQATKPREKGYKLADGGGLYLLIQPSGSKCKRDEAKRLYRPIRPLAKKLDRIAAELRPRREIHLA